MGKNNHLSSIAEYGRQWIEDKKNNDFDGAKFFWNKDKAREFSNVGIEDLLFDEYFLDAEDWLWTGLVDPIKDLWHAYKEEDKNIICVIGGFGSGKTGAIGSVLTWLSWYDFTCKFDPDSDIASPQQYYNLKPTATVAFVALSKTVKKSKDITFSEIKSSFDTQFNDDYFPVNDRVKSEVQIPKNNTVIFPNTATEAANAGYSVYGYVMDEVSFLKITEDSTRAQGGGDSTYNQAESAFQSAEGRRFSRFGNDGIGVLISSVNYDEDFLVSTVRDIYNYPEDNEDKVYKILLPWKANPADAGWDDGYFYFDTESHEIIDDPEEIAALNRYYQEPEIDDLIFDNPENHDNYEILDRLASGDIVLDEEEIEIAKNNKAYNRK